MPKLALCLVALQKFAASAEGGFSQEQAQKLLPYVLAVRASAAVWDGTAELYAQAVDSVLTPEQRQALEAARASFGDLISLRVSRGEISPLILAWTLANSDSKKLLPRLPLPKGRY